MFVNSKNKYRENLDYTRLYDVVGDLQIFNNSCNFFDFENLNLLLVRRQGSKLQSSKYMVIRFEIGKGE